MTTAHDPGADGIPVAPTPAGGYGASMPGPFLSGCTEPLVEDGVHVLRPVGLPIEVTRRRKGDRLEWAYLGFSAFMERMDIVEDLP